jgi:hypothetical protein
MEAGTLSPQNGWERLRFHPPVHIIRTAPPGSATNPGALRFGSYFIKGRFENLILSS